MADAVSGSRISEQEYNNVIKYPGQTPKEKWGLNLIGRENIIEYSP